MFPTPNPIPRVPTAFLAVSMMAFVTASSSTARELRTIYLPGSGETIGKAFLVNSENAVEVGLPQRNLSPDVELPKGDLVMAALSAPPVEGEEIPAGAPTVRIPGEWQRTILIFLGDPGNKVFPVRVIPVNATTVDFPKGTTLVYNLSAAIILGEFGTQRLELEPGKTETFGAPMNGFGGYPVAIDCIPEGEDSARAIFRSTWQHDPDARQILFVIPRSGKQIPRIWGVLDRSEDTPAKAP